MGLYSLIYAGFQFIQGLIQTDFTICFGLLVITSSRLIRESKTSIITPGYKLSLFFKECPVCKNCAQYRWVSELLFIAKWAMFQLYHDKNKLHFKEMMMMFSLYKTNKLSWNKSKRVDMLLHSRHIILIPSIYALTP